mgnify:CR=1 FL=1
MEKCVLGLKVSGTRVWTSGREVGGVVVVTRVRAAELPQGSWWGLPGLDQVAPPSLRSAP